MSSRTVVAMETRDNNDSRQIYGTANVAVNEIILNSRNELFFDFLFDDVYFISVLFNLKYRD